MSSRLRPPTGFGLLTTNFSFIDFRVQSCNKYTHKEVDIHDKFRLNLENVFYQFKLFFSTSDGKSKDRDVGH
jgi:hypothetical protein